MAVKFTTAEIGIAAPRPMFIAAGTAVAGRTRHRAIRPDFRSPVTRYSDTGKPRDRNKQVEDDQERGYVTKRKMHFITP
jgi:hypothetical protein